jgi:ABC-type uncharacterized transport system permease subunit
MHYTILGALPVTLLLVDSLLLLFLRYEVAHPPQWPARWRGYKTPASLRNPQTWQEANTYSYRWLGRLVKSTFVVQVGVLLFTSLSTALAFTAGYIVVGGLALLPLTEWHLHRLFTAEGIRRAD